MAGLRVQSMMDSVSTRVGTRQSLLPPSDKLAQ